MAWVSGSLGGRARSQRVSVSPAGTLAATLAALAAAAAYGSGPVLLLCAVPMIIIANSYRRLNLWQANAGASFEWVGRSINPYLGFMTGWLMVVGYIIGTVAEVVVLGPAVLAVFGSSSTNRWAGIAIDTGLCLVMLLVAVVGIKLTARTQISMAVVEYTIIIGFAIMGPCGGDRPPPRDLPDHERLVQAIRSRREGRPRRCPARRGVRLQLVGRHALRERGSQAPQGQPR